MQNRVPQPSSRTGITRRTLLCGAAASLLPRIYALPAYSTHKQTALTDILRNTSAIAIIFHQRSGKVLARHGDVTQSNTPGSILKPLLLFGAFQQNLVAPATTVFCRRDLHIGGRSYPCTHPQSNISFTAQEAIAYSCNTWFASLALRFTPSRLVETLRAFHLYSVLTPESPERNQLLTLGLAGVTTSPSEIATAYRILGNQLGQSFALPVADGLHDSVSFGMAHNADTSGIDISGKTGTADDSPRQPWSHGWFAGFATIRGTPLVISLYLPRGNGADAAQLARNFFLARNKTIS
jgi:cell division protein FtsI/penicillin-binding protein 2